MTSIRGRLLGWLLPGLGVLMGMTGTALYLAVRHGLESRIDAELRSLSGPVRFLARERMMGHAEPLLTREEFSPFSGPDGVAFFTIWNTGEEPLLRSPSLGDRNLPRPDGRAVQGAFRDHQLVDGTRVRLFSVRTPVGPPGRPRGLGPPSGEPRKAIGQPMWSGEPKHGPRGRFMRMGGGEGLQQGVVAQVELVVAKDRRELDETLHLLLGLIVVAGICAAMGAVLLVKMALLAGLRPLNHLGDEAGSIDAGSLGKRFATETLPEELRPIAERLNGLMTRLETAFERERRFGGDLAHELRTPVAELRSLAEVAIKWPQEATGDSHAEVLAIAERMQLTIENLLRLARMEHRSATENRRPVALSELVREAWQPFAATARRRGLKAVFQIDESRRVAAEPELLRTIVENLLSNATEYAPEDSDILVSGDSAGTVLSVGNQAPDLTPGDLPCLFERLWRKDRSRTDGDHSGLGLALARACSEAVGWRLEAELRDGRLQMTLKEKGE